jgi:hypothetical protein
MGPAHPFAPWSSCGDRAPPPKEIPAHLPHLTLAQVLDALNYYSDHQEAINQYIDRNQVLETLIDPLVHGS